MCKSEEVAALAILKAENSSVSSGSSSSELNVFSERNFCLKLSNYLPFSIGSIPRILLFVTALFAEQ